jgi:hypothetical protein
MAESPGFFKERPLPTIELTRQVLRHQTRLAVFTFRFQLLRLAQALWRIGGPWSRTWLEHLEPVRP